MLIHGGYKHILGVEGNTSIVREMSIWDGVVVSAMNPVFERRDDRRDATSMDSESEENEAEEPMDEAQ